jgi:DNA-binding NarL/FixJ family response regulator
MEGYSIILADDHTLFRTGMASLLKNIPNVEKIYEAANGLEVISWLKSCEGKIDLVLLDLKMPEMNGLETCREVKRLFPATKIVILTMIDQEQVIVQMLKEDINAYLLKNCSEETLYKTITEVLTKGFYFNDQMVRLIHRSLMSNKKNDQVPHYFSKRELEVIEALCDGLTTSEIAEKLFISPRTVETHKQNLLEKTESRSSVELALYAIKNGLLDLKPLLDN